MAAVPFMGLPLFAREKVAENSTIFLHLSFVIYGRKKNVRRLSITGKEDFVDIDFWLLQRMKHGDENAFDVFVRKHYEEILKYCSYHCFDKSSAEDLTQETFLRFFEKLSDYRYMGKTRNYLYTIAGNLCRDSYKKIHESLMEEQNLERQESFRFPESDKPLDDRLLEQLTVQEALNSLPDELREVIVLYYFQSLKLVEISHILQISLSLVKYRIRQAKIQLKERLGSQ